MKYKTKYSSRYVADLKSSTSSASFQASAAVYIRSSLFWDVMQCVW